MRAAVFRWKSNISRIPRHVENENNSIFYVTRGYTPRRVRGRAAIRRTTQTRPTNRARAARCGTLHSRRTGSYDICIYIYTRVYDTARYECDVIIYIRIVVCYVSCGATGVRYTRYDGRTALSNRWEEEVTDTILSTQCRHGRRIDRFYPYRARNIIIIIIRAERIISVN